MSSSTQISAVISVATKMRLEQYARASGATKAHIIEQALEHYLRALAALAELPLDVIVPAKMVLTPESAERVRDLTSHPPEPPAAMKSLLHDR